MLKEPAENWPQRNYWDLRGRQGFTPRFLWQLITTCDLIECVHVCVCVHGCISFVHGSWIFISTTVIACMFKKSLHYKLDLHLCVCVCVLL